MRGRVASSMNFLINPGMDQEAIDISQHIVEVFKKATGPNNILITTRIIIPGDHEYSENLGDPSAYETEDRSMTSGMNEPQQELVERLSKLEEKFQAFERMDKKLTIINGSVDTLNSSISNLTSSGTKSETAMTEGSTVDYTLAEDILKSTLQQIDSLNLQQLRSQSNNEVKSAVKEELTDVIMPKICEINKLVEELAVAERDKSEKMNDTAIAEVVQSQLTQVIMPKLAELGKAVANIQMGEETDSHTTTTNCENAFVNAFSDKMLKGINPSIQAAVAANMQDATSSLLRVQAQVNTRPALDIAREVSNLIQPALSSIRTGILRIAVSSELQSTSIPGTVLGDSKQGLTSTYNELIEMKCACFSS